MAKKLHYFHINGIAESIRYILHYTEQKFEDVRYDHTTWPDQSIKDSLPYGQFPKYEEGSKVLTQSLAIARYVAAKTSLMPKDLWDQAVADSAVHNIYDYWSKVVPSILEKDPKIKEEMVKKIKEELIVYYFSRFERDLKTNGGYFTGKLSWAEFVLLGIIESTNLFLNLNVEKDYPTVNKVVNEIRSAAPVKKYIASRKPYVAF